MAPRNSTEGISVAVERAFDILEMIGTSESGHTNSELSRALKIPKSSASYILRTLERRGYLRKDRFSGNFKLGFHFLTLSRGALAGMELKEAAAPVLRKLADRTSFTANLAVLDRREIVYIEKAEAAGFIKMDTWIGKRLPAHATSAGKALLAFLPPKDLDTLMKGRILEKRTPKTITNYVKLLKELGLIRRQGFSMDDEESSRNVYCLGAPVRNRSGSVEAAISISGIKAQVQETGIRRMATLVIDAAREISEQLGHTIR